LAYYTKVIQAGEDVKFLGKLHWIIYKMPIFFGLLAILFGILDALGYNKLTDQIPVFSAFWIIFLCIAIVSFLRPWYRRTTTEIVVTDRRIICKRGWISRHTEEMNISKIETVDIKQSMLGRILGYGDILVIGTGASLEPVYGVSRPIELRNKITAG
jgi:uncharacterized membrane protein YdbT with pleckstrin-like domain